MRSFEEIREDVRAAFASNDRAAFEGLIDELDALHTDEATALAVNVRGQVHANAGDFDKALEYYQRSYDLYVHMGEPRLALITLGNSANIYRRRGEYASAIEILMRGLEACQEMGDLSNVAVMLGNIGVIYAEQGDVPRSLEYYQRAVAIHTDQENWTRAAPLLGNIGILYREMGDYPRALEHLQRAIGMMEDHDRENTASILGSIATVYANIGDYATAIEYGKRSLSIGQMLNDKVNQAVSMTILGNAYRESHDLETARDYYKQAKEINTALGLRSGLIVSKINLIGIAIDLGNIEEAAVLLDELTQAMPDHPEQRSWCYRYMARIAQHRGDLEAAERHLTTALSILHEAGFRDMEATVHLTLRDIAKDRGDFAGYILHNDTYHSITQELRGREAMQQLAAMEAERKVEAELKIRDKERALLYGTLPQEVADRMVKGEKVDDHFEHASVLFADIVGFTIHTSTMDARVVTELLERLYRRFDQICAQRGVTKVKTIGDSYLCFKGNGTADENARAIAAVACAFSDTTFTWPTSNDVLQLRMGIHSGPVSSGVIGTERLQYDVWGDTVNVASRMESTGEPGRIHVSQAFAFLLTPSPSHLRERGANASIQKCEEGPVIPRAKPEEPFPIAYSLFPRGEVEVKGKGSMTTYWLERPLS